MTVLVRAGANISVSKEEKVISAVDAASKFPDIVRWLLVDRYTDQGKLYWTSEEEESARLRTQAATSSKSTSWYWNGPVQREVPTRGLYSPTYEPSILEKAIELARLEKDLRGKVVTIDGFYSIAI